MIKHFNIKIIGQVQEIGFRRVSAQTARELGIAGFVRNEPDGSVYLAAEGEAENLEKFLAFCRGGYPPARVDDLRVLEGRLKNYLGFVIHH